jgi:dipeptidyl-peptidase-4
MQKSLMKAYLPLILILLIILCLKTEAQRFKLNWTPAGDQYFRATGGEILKMDPVISTHKTTLLSRENLTPAGASSPLLISGFTVSPDEKKVLIFTNTKRVWRYNTKGDYWVFDQNTQTLKPIGKSLPSSSLMFAKLSPDGNQVAYVSGHNLYIENLNTGAVNALTTDGNSRLINGTFDWAYEEEFDCRDGFRWSPDSKSIAFWQIDARTIKNYLMLNTTDSIYPFVVPVEYPVAGENPSACRIGIVNIENQQITWMKVPGDPIQHYITRMEWANNSSEIILEQLNRAQNESRIYLCQIQSGESRLIHEEKGEAWIDGKSRWNEGDPTGWEWIQGGKFFLWISEKDGWRHIYSISREGKEKLLSPGNYDMIELKLIDEASGYIYFMASPENATQEYLYRIKLSGGKPERISPVDEPGTHSYEISPNGKIALHNFSNIYTIPQREVIGLPDHKHLNGENIKINPDVPNKPEFFKVKTSEGIEMDGWMVKPLNFDPNKKYPIVFYVYSEPAGATVTDSYGSAQNREYLGNMALDGYIYVSLDNRGTPAPKGTAWRKAIYKKIGIVNIQDQALGAKEVLKFPYVDTSRVAVWGWSGGGSCTLNLMFQHPEIYKTGISIAAVGWELSYDNIYQERYMGVPNDEEGRSYFINGSPITYAKNLRGNLLYVHGTGDDNVHYRNAELLINELVKYNKQFQLMSYPNRSHGIFEGEGTSAHLRTLFTQYLREHCPPGGR